MKLKLSLALAGNTEHDVTLACDVTTTVREVADALIRSGAFRGTNIEEFSALRFGHVTLIGGPAREREYLLDPGAPIGQSGIQSGWRIRVVGEFDTSAPRLVPAVGLVEVLTGEQAGARFSLVSGSNMVGRDEHSRVRLDDRSVSRRHAVIEAGERIVLRDLGSANGIESLGQRFQSLPLERVLDVTLGTVTLRITPFGPARSSTAPNALAPVGVASRGEALASVHAAAPATGGEPLLDHRREHTRAPRVDPTFPVTSRELPAPPQRAAGNRIPLLAMLAPMLMGTAMFAITRSPMSLVMVAFTPIMMIGAWLDGRLASRRKRGRDDAGFADSIASEREQLAASRAEEILVRGRETPTHAEIFEAMSSQSRLLWCRRPEHGSFLELRFGEGELPSRTEIRLPKRGDALAEQWATLRAIEQEFSTVAPVPVTERLDRCGSIGLAGPVEATAGLARSLLLQLVGLHSPAELALAVFAGAARDSTAATAHAPENYVGWEWLKWLPHVDHVGSPIPVWQLADSEKSAATLLSALEAVADGRSGGGGSRSAKATIRSHLSAESGGALGEPAVSDLPMTPVITVLVLDGEIVPAHRPRLIALAEAGPDLGIHFIWVAAETAHIPAACRTFVELGAATVSFVRQRRVVQLNRVEHADTAVAASLARAISPVDDTAARALDESDLPQRVQLRELHGVDLLGGHAPIAQSWERSGSVMRQWRRGDEREPVALRAVVGHGSDATVALDLRAHGPHALVGGTTGSGKSEFLQSWIMSLAANLSPDRLTLLLIDYKGGAAFAECVDLPHTVGLVTDLSPHLVRRALTSLRAELRRREELLAEHNAKDLFTLEQRSDPAAPPVLVIVIDEFAALVNDVPEFVDGVIDVAQRGRSLGLHLIMATQRPAGVVTDNLRANTNLRVALRMADEGDSNDVIGVPDAAFFAPETPGRGAIKVGPGRISHFQTGYVGGRATQGSAGTGLEVRSLGFAEGPPWVIPGERGQSGARPQARPQSRTQPQAQPQAQPQNQPARDIERLRDSLIAAATACELRQPRRPWLPPLPERVALEDVLAEPRQGTPFGLADHPDEQSQDPVTINFDEVGNVAVFGAGGAGKTTALLTLAAAVSAGAANDPVHIYAIDAGGGSLDALSALPTVGGVAQLADVELTQRILRHIEEVITERGAAFAEARASSLAAYRAQAAGGSRAAPRVLLLIDGFGAVAQVFEGAGQQAAAAQRLAGIMRSGRAVGVHVVLTADRPAAVPAALAASVQAQFVLRLASPSEYAYVGVSPEAFEGAPPGRGVLAGRGEELQLALSSAEPDLAAQADALSALAERLRAAPIVPPVALRNAPERILLTDLPATTGGRPVFGVQTDTLASVGLPVSGLGVVAGPAGAGLSTAVRSCVRAIERMSQGNDEAVDRVLLTLAPQSETGAETVEWDRVARGDAAVTELAGALVAALGGKPHRQMPSLVGVIGDDLSLSGDDEPVGLGRAARSAAVPHAAADLAIEFPRRGSRGVIVVERATDAEGSEALPQLVALAKVARRAGVLVLFEFEQSTGAGVWELFTALKQPTWGLALQPDDGEGQTPFRESLGRVSRADFPPGRGFAVERGRVTPVHVALP